MMRVTLEQTREDLDVEREGLQVPCPFCASDDDVDYQPRPYLALGCCHECHREFEVIVRWEEE